MRPVTSGLFWGALLELVIGLPAMALGIFLLPFIHTWRPGLLAPLPPALAGDVGAMGFLVLVQGCHVMVLGGMDSYRLKPGLMPAMALVTGNVAAAGVLAYLTSPHGPWTGWGSIPLTAWLLPAAIGGLFGSMVYWRRPLVKAR